MDYKELQKGDFVKWNAERMFKTWNTYGIVTNINKKTVTIKTFDDMKETTLALQGEAIKDEVSVVSIEQIGEYLSKKETNLQIKIIETESKFKTDMKHLNKQIDVLHELTKSICL